MIIISGLRLLKLIYITIALPLLLIILTGCDLITSGQSGLYEDPQLLSDNWEYSWNFSLENINTGDSNWHKVIYPFSKLKKESNTVWFRTTLPDKLPMHPALFIRDLYLALVVYVDSRQIYAFWDTDANFSKDFIPKKSHFIALPDSAAGQNIYFKIQSNYHLIGITGPVLLGTEYTLIKNIILSDIANIIIASIAFFIGFFSLTIFIINRKQWQYFYFGFFALLLNLYILNYTSIRDLLLDTPLLWICLWLLSSVWSTTMFIGFTKVFFNYQKKSILGILFVFNTYYAIFETIVILAGIGELYFTGNMYASKYILGVRYIFQYLLIVDVIIIISVMINQFKAGNKEAGILLAGLIVLCITVLHSVVVAIGYLTYDFRSYIHWGLFFLLLSLSFILIRQYTLLQTSIALSKADMNTARRIQQSIIPAIPPLHQNLRISSLYIPAEIVGGDFFDYIIISQHEIGIFIADITGHGVSAALIASMCKIAFHSSSKLCSNPSALLENINVILADKTAGQLLSALYVYINTSNNTLIAASAGHPRCIIINRKTKDYNELPTKGRIIGAFDRLNCNNIIYPLDHDQRIILYTDGLIEACNPSGEMYGEYNFFNLLIQTLHMLPEDTCLQIKKDIYTWAANEQNLYDDMTIILIDVIDFT